jgi:alginate O-acetyltransferase complex protein AlgI
MNANTNAFDVGRGAIFYDDACGFCTGLARRTGPTLERRGFKLVGLHSPIAQQLTGATLDDLMRELYVATPDHTVHRGVDAILFILSAWPWLRPICAIGRWPGINWMLRAGYALFARNRYRVSGACAIGPSPKRSRLRAIARWLPLIVLPISALIFARDLAPWAYMLMISFSIFYACKWLTLFSAARSRSALRSLGYFFLWTGMDAREFLGPRTALSPSRREWSVVGIKMLIGAAMLFVVPLAIDHVLARTWCMMIGLVLLAHFGLFHLVALLWQSHGVRAEPVMIKPAQSESLADLWGRRWNTAFNVLARDYIFEPLRRRANPLVAMLAVFVASGLIHDIAISIPARGGYGLPMLYFLIQCAGLLVQRSRPARRLGVGRGLRGWLFTTLIAVLPMPLLFHPPFVMNVMRPMLEPIHAQPRLLVDHLPALLLLAGIMHLCITSAGVVMTIVCSTGDKACRASTA